MSQYALKDLLRLDLVPRWQLEPMLRTQSVAEHSFRVAAIVMDLCDAFQADPDVQAGAVMWAIMHDGPEAETGDIDYRVKQYVKSAIELYETEKCPWAGKAKVMIPRMAIILVKIADYIEGAAYAWKWGHPDARQRMNDASMHNAYEWCAILQEQLGNPYHVKAMCEAVARDAGAIPVLSRESFHSPAREGDPD